MKSNMLVIIISVLIASSILVFSYTQIDLSLTLSHQSFVKSIQQGFQHIGYYKRPTAAAWITLTILGLSVFYCYLVYTALKQKLSSKSFWIIVGVMSVILFFSYPAVFSYDIFNYIFYAKLVLLYEKSPYLVIPLQFQGIDPMLSFMRWTHVPSAYTPLWIIASLPFYLMSIQSLFLAFFTMKLLPLFCYLGSIYIIGMIMEKLDKPMKIASMALFALNPLILIESLVSGHNDIVMMLPALIAYALYIHKHKLASFFALSLSIAVKFMTFPLLLPFFIGWKRIYSVFVLFAGLCMVLLKRQLLPWYFVWIIPFTALLPRMHSLQILISSMSIGLVATYIPLIYYGPTDSRLVNSQQMLFFISIGVGVLFSAVYTIKKQRT